ncbi:MAG TPA: polysaccharide deacetylase family protein [Xanthobacteraceae bacterium]|nr:polysaccharide deacetylase family protein [Xanthobacteraceae bacterium]
MLRWLGLWCGLAVLCASSAARAAECSGNPDALGVGRIIAAAPGQYARIGTMQYADTLPLADKELVLTFDDGPLPPYTNRVLDILAAECVRATFFVVGRMARAYPKLVQRIYAEGHTVGTHSETHPGHFNEMPITRMQTEVEDGIASAAAALGSAGAVAPFFRIPGLRRGKAVETYLRERGLMVWSADFPADDWRHISASEIVNVALRRLEAKRRGILLLHDIQPATALALPELLRELKSRGYRIVHVVPASSEPLRSASAPQEWLLARSRQAWPQIVNAKSPPAQRAANAVTVAPLELRSTLPPAPLDLRPVIRPPLVLSN